jgi:hypothetical protein
MNQDIEGAASEVSDLPTSDRLSYKYNGVK